MIGAIAKTLRPARASAGSFQAAAVRASSSHYPNKSTVSAKHWEKEWSKDQLLAESQGHVMATWGPGGPLRGAPLLVRGEGVYVYDIDGNKFLDWTSQAVCCNLGYTVPDSVKNAARHQMETLAFAYSGFSNCTSRIRLASLMSELLPGDLTGFLFPTSGAEANEAAIRMARRFTGKTKIINQYRSYHGGTSGTVQATGDFRRNFAEGRGGEGAPGFIKTMNATDSPLFSFGKTDEDRTSQALAYLEEQIICEGPGTIAAVMFESLVGSGGVFKSPPGYMEGVRALCDKYDILMICDEVMVGFGRTGKMWGFQHYDILPDIVTSAKGLTGAWAPLSMVACREKIKDFFETNPIGWGSTFQAHPTSCAVGFECLKWMLEKDLLGHVQTNLAPVIKSEIERLCKTYKSVGEGRAVGAFGAIDLLDPRTGLPVQDFAGKTCSHPEAVLTLRKTLRANGIHGMIRPPRLHCAPPLVNTVDELKDGFLQVEKAIDAYDKCF